MDRSAMLAKLKAHMRTNGSCWEWTRARHKQKGYGLTSDESGRQVRVHRLAWMLYVGPIAPGLCVLHRCDNPACWRPDHLFTGSKGDNNRDRHAKGRDQRGERHWKAKLTERDVMRIHSMRSAGVSTAGIAASLGVPFSTVHPILTGRNWKHVPLGQR